MKTYKVRLRIWIDEKQQGAFVGIGRILLLENIKKTGSITNAAKGLKMSYRRAWQLVEDMNARARKPLVEKKLGGAGGGGACITSAGEETIRKFYELENRIKEFAYNEATKIEF